MASRWTCASHLPPALWCPMRSMAFPSGWRSCAPCTRASCRDAADLGPRGRPSEKPGMVLDSARLLSDLIACPSVNPMGRDDPSGEFGERALTDYLETFFRRL